MTDEERIFIHQAAKVFRFNFGLIHEELDHIERRLIAYFHRVDDIDREFYLDTIGGE